MHQKYVDLFKELTHAVEVLAEQVMEYNREKKDEKGTETAQSMRDDYIALYDKLHAEGFDPSSLSRSEYARLLVAVLIIINNLETRITNEQKAISNYKDMVIPKLERIIDESKTDEEAIALAAELFQIKDEDK